MNKDLIRLAVIALVALGGLAIASSFYQQSEISEEDAAVAQQLASATARLERDHSPTIGPKDAPVVVVEFLDPECEACRSMHPIVKQLLAEFEGQVRYVLRYRPLHKNSGYAALALEAAREQGQYWEMLDLLFERQPVWGNHQQPRPDLIPDYAKELGLDMGSFERFVNSPANQKPINQDNHDGIALGVRGTPTFFVNGRRLRELGAVQLRDAIRDGLGS
ncbi:MAG: DsbA family protein [Myxococcota bacterium]